MIKSKFLKEKKMVKKEALKVGCPLKGSMNGYSVT